MTDKRKLEQLEESLNFEKKKEAKMLEELSKRIEQVREEEKIIAEDLPLKNSLITKIREEGTFWGAMVPSSEPLYIKTIKEDFLGDYYFLDLEGDSQYVVIEEVVAGKEYVLSKDEYGKEFERVERVIYFIIGGEELGRSNRVVTLSESDFFSRSSKNNPTFGNFFDAVAEIDNRGLPKEE